MSSALPCLYEIQTSADNLSLSSEAYSCLLRLKSSSDDEVVKMQPASGETFLL